MKKKRSAAQKAATKKMLAARKKQLAKKSSKRPAAKRKKNPSGAAKTKLKTGKGKIWVIAIKSPQGKYHYLKTTGQSFSTNVKLSMIFKTSKEAISFFKSRIQLPKSYESWEVVAKDYALSSITGKKQ